MDEANRIVADLQQKLDDLDHKVVQYRHDMCSEFEKFEREVLRNVTQDVSSKVTKAIAASLKNYPALHPELQNTSTSTPDHAPNNNSLHAHATQDEPPRSPHEREREFTGVFTPSYLPLLDSTDRYERRSSQDMSKVQSSRPNKSHDSNSPVMQTVVADPANPSTPTVILQRPPTPLRKNTDTSVVSNGSDSDSTLRKSALRRSSSSASHSILSPRKVRFALEGHEYPTDSSPQPPTIEEELPKRNPITLGWYSNDSDDEAGSEQVENIEEPPPKRISSSQALRALSREPLAEEDGTKWTEVAAPPDGSASVPLEEAMDSKAYIDADDDEPGENSVAVKTRLETEKCNNQDLENLSETDINESSQREALQKAREVPALEPHTTNSIPVKSSEPPRMNGKAAAQPPAESQASQTIPTSSINSRLAPRKNKSAFSFGDSDSESESENEQDNEAEDDDIMFEFEDGTESRNQKENVSAKAETRPDISRFSPSDVTSPRMSSFRQTNPGVGSISIAGSLGKQYTGASGSYDASGSYQRGSKGAEQTVGTPSGIDYSYKGNLPQKHSHPFNRPIVSERVQHKAQEMGDFQSWVGSVDGRSGVDDRPGDSGFRGSLGIAGSLREGGQPRSFSERMMMEEELEKAKARQ